MQIACGHLAGKIHAYKFRKDRTKNSWSFTASGSIEKSNVEIENEAFYKGWRMPRHGDRIRQWEGKGTRMAGNISEPIVFRVQEN